jgi:hypothetical protein
LQALEQKVAIVASRTKLANQQKRQANKIFKKQNRQLDKQQHLKSGIRNP